MSKLQEALKSAEFTDEQIAAVEKVMAEQKLYITGEENLDVRYEKLKTDHEGVQGEYEKAQALIKELQGGNKDNEELQAKVAQYEQEVKDLQAENVKIKTDTALQLALRDAGAEDVEYLSFKVRAEGEIKLTEDGKIEGIENTLKDLKTKYPTQFVNNGEGEGKTGKKFEPKTLNDGDENNAGVTKEQFNAMGYKARVELQQSNPELYAELAGK